MSEEKLERGLTQADIARDIGVNRSAINRSLSGGRDITAGRIAQLADAMGRDVKIEFPKKRPMTENGPTFAGVVITDTRSDQARIKIASPDQSSQVFITSSSGVSSQVKKVIKIREESI